MPFSQGYPLSSENSGHFAAVFLLFLLSGLTGLVYEVIWLRELILIFGAAPFATSTILSTFMGGLALGAFVAGRWLGQSTTPPLRLYGMLEIGIGVYAVLVPWLLRALTPLLHVAWNAGASPNPTAGMSAGVVVTVDGGSVTGGVSFGSVDVSSGNTPSSTSTMAAAATATQIRGFALAGTGSFGNSSTRVPTSAMTSSIMIGACDSSTWLYRLLSCDFVAWLTTPPPTSYVTGPVHVARVSAR